jgi:hypothetical protein
VNDIFMPLTLSLCELQQVNPAQQVWILQFPEPQFTSDLTLGSFWSCFWRG